MSSEWSKLLDLDWVLLEVLDYLVPKYVYRDDEESHDEYTPYDDDEEEEETNRGILATHIRLLNRDSKQWAEKHIYSGIWLQYRKNTICIDNWVLKHLLTPAKLVRLLSNPAFAKRLQNASQLIIDFGGQVYQTNNEAGDYNIAYPQMSVERLQRRIYPVILHVMLFMTNVKQLNIFMDVFANYPGDSIIGEDSGKHILDYNRSLNDLFTTVIDRLPGLCTIQFNSYEDPYQTLHPIWKVPSAIRALATHGPQLRRLTFSTASTTPKFATKSELEYAVHIWTTLLNERHLCFDNVLVLDMNIGCLVSTSHIAKWFPQLRSLTAHLTDGENAESCSLSYYPDYYKNFTLSKWFLAFTNELHRLEYASIYCHDEEDQDEYASIYCHDEKDQDGDWIGSVVEKLAPSRSALKTMVLELTVRQGYTEMGWIRHQRDGASLEDWDRRGQSESISTIRKLGQVFRDLRKLKFSAWCTLGVTHDQRLREFHGNDLIRYQKEYSHDFDTDSFFLYNWKLYESTPDPIVVDNVMVYPNCGKEQFGLWTLSDLDDVHPELRPDEVPRTVDHPSVMTVMKRLTYDPFDTYDTVYRNIRNKVTCDPIKGAKLCTSLLRRQKSMIAGKDSQAPDRPSSTNATITF